MAKRIFLLHYAGPPGVGGVEAIIGHQARFLADAGYDVHLLAGSGEAPAPHVQISLHPAFASTDPDVLAVKKQLDAGVVTGHFTYLQDRLLDYLRTRLTRYDLCIAHNVATLHKNLALTAALHTVAQECGCPIVAWCHDLAWTNPQYRAELHDGQPWDLLRQPWPNTRYVTISRARQTELAALMGLPTESITVIGGGVDVSSFLRLTVGVTALADRLDLWSADAILIYPTRLTRRKNIDGALDVLAALRACSGRDVRLIITGPPGPHNPANARYLQSLLDQRASSGLERSAHFLYACGEDPAEPLHLEDEDIASLYALADALLMTTASEGFGIPMLEAGLAGIPIFCTDLPVLREIAHEDAHYFAPDALPGEVAGHIWDVLQMSSLYRMRLRVRQEYRWEKIMARDLVPLLEGSW